MGTKLNFSGRRIVLMDKPVHLVVVLKGKAVYGSVEGKDKRINFRKDLKEIFYIQWESYRLFF